MLSFIINCVVFLVCFRHEQWCPCEIIVDVAYIMSDDVVYNYDVIILGGACHARRVVYVLLDLWRSMVKDYISGDTNC